MSAVVLMLSCAPLVSGMDPKKGITQYVLRIWQREQGLPQNSVAAALQTRDGYLWFGTQEGLVRFDGVRFTVFDKRGTARFNNNVVTSLYEDEGQTLWIGTMGGLLRYQNGVFNTFTMEDGLLSNEVVTLCGGGDQGLWIGTSNGLNQFKDGHIQKHTSLNSPTGQRINCLYKDRSDNLWIGTNEGLMSLSGNTLIEYTTTQGLPGNLVTSICEDHEGRLWVAVFGAGLVRREGAKFIVLTTRDGLPGNAITSLLIDRDDNLWIGLSGSGVARFKEGKFSTFGAKEGLSSDFVMTVSEDREGNVWVGTNGGGLAQFIDGKFMNFGIPEGLAGDFASSVMESRDGSLWIGMDGGLNHFENGVFSLYTAKDGLSSNSITALYESSDGSLWVGTANNGLNHLRDKVVTVYTNKGGSAANSISAIREDSAGALWIGAGRGLSRLTNLAIKTYSPYENMVDKRVESLLLSRDGSLWIGTQGQGLSRLKDEKLTTYTTDDGLAGNYVLRIYEDRDGVLWIGTIGNGLSRYKNNQFFNYTSAQGLFDDTVGQILEDDLGNLWMGSNKGIFRIKKSDLDDFASGLIPSLSFVSYGVSDGMRSAECNGIAEPAAFKTRDGKLWFPTVKGLAVIDPNKLKASEEPPTTIIEEMISDQKPVDLREKVELPPGRGDIEFRYTAPTFIAPGKVKFKYKLEGLNNDWIEAGDRRVAYYTNLKPGSYRFIVLASNGEGVWSQTGGGLYIRLRARFDQTYWFFGLMLVSIVLLAVIINESRLRTLRGRKDELERLVAARTADLLETTERLKDVNKHRADFVSGVSHELKTPLTLIRLYGETLLYGENFSDEARRDYYQIITRESERLTSMVNNVLDFSRMDRGLKQYSFHFDDIGKVVRETVAVHDQYLRRSGFKVHLSIEPDLPLLRIDRDALIEIISNLLDNAVKYSNHSKHISVSLEASSTSVFLAVKDQGLGIPSSELEHIFQQFYRGSNVSGTGGYGIGLYLVKHIMEAHGGTVQVCSEPGQGSQFLLSFPIKI